MWHFLAYWRRKAARTGSTLNPGILRAVLGDRLGAILPILYALNQRQLSVPKQPLSNTSHK